MASFNLKNVIKKRRYTALFFSQSSNFMLNGNFSYAYDRKEKNASPNILRNCVCVFIDIIKVVEK